MAWEIGETNIVVEHIRHAETCWRQWDGERRATMRDVFLAGIEANG